MPDRRQAFRREPIEIDLGDGRIISVGASPWEQRNEIGNEIILQHTRELNESTRLFVLEDSGAPQLEARLANKLTDPFTVMYKALPEAEYAKVVDKKLELHQITEILVAIIEVNEMIHLRPLVDPNFETPGGLGGITSLLMLPEEEEPQKTESGPDSSPGDSVTTTSDSSPTQSSPEFSTN